MKIILPFCIKEQKNPRKLAKRFWKSFGFFSYLFFLRILSIKQGTNSLTRNMS